CIILLLQNHFNIYRRLFRSFCYYLKMGLYEHSDVIQWGIDFLDGDNGYCPGYYSNAYQYDNGDAYTEHCYHSHYDPYIGDCSFHSHYDAEESNQVENDEIIARTLQEEFQQLQIAEQSRQSQAEEQQFPVSDYWPNTPTGNYCTPGHDYTHEEVNGVGTSYSCYSPHEVTGYSLEQTDKYPFDDEIEKRLSQMDPIRHVPRINGEIPSIDEATSDHQRLLDRLQLFDFVEHQVQGDGNCQFRALSDQLYNTPDHHDLVRQEVVNQLRSHREIYEGYVPMEYGAYLEKMSKSGEWGDHVTLQAAADSYCVRIFVMTSFKDTCCIEIVPHFEKQKGVIFLSFWAEVHYNSIYPQGDIPSIESRRKKRWWNFGTRH
ncbi:hypothetical protein S245_041854, partial [Arachis hypogaea]